MPKCKGCHEILVFRSPSCHNSASVSNHGNLFHLIFFVCTCKNMNTWSFDEKEAFFGVLSRNLYTRFLCKFFWTKIVLLLILTLFACLSGIGVSLVYLGKPRASMRVNQARGASGKRYTTHISIY